MAWKKVEVQNSSTIWWYKTEEQVNLAVQEETNDEPVTYSKVDPPRREEAKTLSHSDNLRSRKSATLLGIVDHKENELMLIEHEVINSSTPYSLM